MLKNKFFGNFSSLLMLSFQVGHSAQYIKHEVIRTGLSVCQFPCTYSKLGKADFQKSNMVMKIYSAKVFLKQI
jgi:hypothetical protein